MQLRHLVIDNFFDYNQLIYLLPYLREREHFFRNEHPEYQGIDSVWPGKRSLDIFKVEPPLACLFGNAMGDLFPQNASADSMSLYTHFRYDNNNDQDWVHQDGTPITTIVYLSETNMNSGTQFFDAVENGNLILDVPFVQNRAVIFNGDVPHCSKCNYGTTDAGARFTMNFFSHG